MAKAKGSEKIGGRTKGTPNKLTATVKEVFQDTFNELQKDPKAKLQAWAKENPTEFYKLCSKMIPAAVEMKADISTVEQVFKIGDIEIKL